jgi:hypothetical protein
MSLRSAYILPTCAALRLLPLHRLQGKMRASEFRDEELADRLGQGGRWTPRAFLNSRGRCILLYRSQNRTEKAKLLKVVLWTARWTAQLFIRLTESASI